MHELTALGRKYGTDKAGGRAGNHTFTERVYGPLFEKKKNEPLSLLEIGAGKVGGSHKMWKEYFTQGEIYCMDPFFLPDQDTTIEELEDLGIQVIRGNQLRRDDLLTAAAASPGGYDYIIDDAAHVPDAIQLSLGILFPALKPGGFYIIEDLATATRRGQDLEATNVNLGKLDSQGLMTERHTEEHILEESLEAYNRTNQWLSKTLTPTESAYLVENIQEWIILDDGARLKNICIIKKKSERQHNG